MEHIFAIPWHDLLMPKPSWAEKILRPVLVYLVLFLIFRVASKRELAQATLFDFLIILMISNVVQNAMIGDDNSILGAAVGAAILILVAGILNRIAARSHKARVVLEGNPILLVHSGRICEEAMKSQSVTRYDLFSNIRKAGLIHLADVAFAILELDGSISIIRKADEKHPPNCLPPEILEAIGLDPEHSESNEDTPVIAKRQARLPESPIVTRQHIDA